MASPFFARAYRPTSLPRDASTYICLSCRRQQSTFRRTRKALKVKPDPSFLPSTTETQDHIIFNPPSSAPNVYHTPQKFLPKSDPRRSLHAFASSTSSGLVSPPASTSYTTISKRLPPAVRTPYEKKYHLGQAEIDEMRRLRAEDPRKWTRNALAEKFDCSNFFVGLCCSSPMMKAEMDRELAAIKAKWGRRKMDAVEERKARKALWGRDG